MSARIVFDLDGTLIDSAADIQHVANQTLAELNLAPITLEQTRSFIGEGAPRLVERICAVRNISDQDQPAVLSRFLELYPHAVERTIVFEGVMETLNHLKQHGHMLGICTNKPMAPTKTTLAHLGLDKLMDTVVAGDSLPQRKPDPSPLELAYSQLGEGPKIYVGDSGVDAQTAQNAGVPFILYTQGYTNANGQELVRAAQFEDFSKLNGLVEFLLAKAA